MSATFSLGSSLPSCISSHTADDMIALVQEKTQYKVSLVAGFSAPPCTARPTVRIAAILPLRAIAIWLDGNSPSLISRSARMNNPRDLGPIESHFPGVFCKEMLSGHDFVLACAILLLPEISHG